MKYLNFSEATELLQQGRNVKKITWIEDCYLFIDRGYLFQFIRGTVKKATISSNAFSCIWVEAEGDY